MNQKLIFESAEQLIRGILTRIARQIRSKIHRKEMHHFKRSVNTQGNVSQTLSKKTTRGKMLQGTKFQSMALDNGH